MQLQNIPTLNNINFVAYSYGKPKKEYNTGAIKRAPIVDTFERSHTYKPPITDRPQVQRRTAQYREALNKYRQMAGADTVANGVTPKISSKKQWISLDEINEFHNNIAKKNNRDIISYGFYKARKDIGRDFTMMVLPIEVAKDDKTRSAMSKEIKRLLSDDSKLSKKQKEHLSLLYKEYLI